ncbi:ribokinase [Metabacillus litoralis]|uniref:ribokinase n=1 Tax=Metabacillus litoralis TaxID=152268 RepID=UPI001CFF0153|nr:ribokinase [Metabacillus litoralis]
MEKPNILVIGSINMDLVTETNIIPNVGETVLGDSFQTIPGGKGANQAVAAAKLGAEVTLLGCIGDDDLGNELKNHLKDQGICIDYINTIQEQSTGIASITLSEGDNSIIVVPGANSMLTPQLVRSYEDLIAKSDMILVQLEIPLKSVMETAALATKHHVPMILNPAPIQDLPKELLLQATYLTPNEHEQAALLATSDLSSEELEQVKKKCITTQGSKGVRIYDEVEKLIPAFNVEGVDSTGAGDTFNGALAVFLTRGLSIIDACQFANAAAALSVTKLGAQSGMPSLLEVKEFLAQHNK